MILLAVVLFAALSYAVTNSIQGGSKDGSSESADAAAAEILQWFAAVDNAVMRMKLNGIAYEDMSFIYDARYFSGAALNGYMHNTRCTTDTCRLFKTEGGGVKPPDFSQYGNWNATGSAPSNLGPGYIAPFMMRWPGAATDLNDVVIQIYYLNAAVCDAVKRKIAQTTTPSTSGTWISGNGVSNWDNPAYTFTANYTSLYGFDTYVGSTLYSGTAGAWCHIYHVVIKR